MPIIERDPWRLQYFEQVRCPEHIGIPTEESDAWRLYPKHRAVFNKLTVAESQGLACAPHGIAPPGYPVFSKPVYNLRGMGVGSRVLRSPAEYEQNQAPGHFWMELLEGEHVSSDAAIQDGRAVWWRHVVGHPAGEGRFDYWTVLAGARPALEQYCGRFIAEHLRGYTGMVNVETIGTRIIELHLRFADQWPDLYGAGWIEAVVRLYERGVWEYEEGERCESYSVVLFGMHGVEYRHPAPDVVRCVLARPEVSSVQITFADGAPAALHAMPPGGFRLAIVNCRDLAAGLAAREELSRAFPSH